MTDRPTANAERQRRSRERKREGLRRFVGFLPPELLDTLITNHWTDHREASNPEELGAVLINLADCWSRGVLSPVVREKTVSRVTKDACCGSMTPHGSGKLITLRNRGKHNDG